MGIYIMESQATITIPFMGDASVNNDVMPSQIADWIEPQDKVPLLLALSLYGTPRQQLENFVLISSLPRIAVWFDLETRTAIIGLRGTSVTQVGNKQDIKDDTVRILNFYFKNLEESKFEF